MDIGDIGKVLGKNPHIDKMGDVIEFFLDHRDELDKLIGIVQAAPAMLATIANGLGDAGDEAKKASTSLAGPTGKGGAAATLTSGAGTLVNVGGQLEEAADFLSDISLFMAKVEIPNVEAKFTKVAGVNIVSGLDISREKLLADPAKQLKQTSASLAKAKGDLAGLADNLTDLAGILAAVGGALDKLGDGLKSSGAQAAKLFD